MPRHYHRQIDDDDDEMSEMRRTELVFAQMSARGRHWPKTIGIVEIMIGILITLLGMLEVFIIPMMSSKDGKDLIVFDQRNCYGCGLFAGLVMVITGSTAIRASISQRNTTVYRFFNLTILSVLIYTGLTIFLIIAYSKGWTSPGNHTKYSKIEEVHVFVTIFTVLGLIFAVTGFVQYFDVICHGEYSLWAHWLECLEPLMCCCTPADQSQILESGLSEDPFTQNNII